MSDSAAGIVGVVEFEVVGPSKLSNRTLYIRFPIWKNERKW